MPATVLGTGDTDGHDKHGPFPRGTYVLILSSISMSLCIQVWEQETKQKLYCKVEQKKLKLKLMDFERPEEN